MKHMVVAVSFVFLMALVSRAQTTEPSISPARIAARKELGALGVEYSGASFVKQASEGDTIAVKLFLEAGMNPDVTDKDGYTALAKSAGSGFRETVQLLIAAGAKVDVKGPSGDTPLIAGDTPLIVAAQNNHPDVVALLVENGADVNAADDRGQSPLIAGASYEGVVKVLLSHGADAKAKGGLALIGAAAHAPASTIEALLDKGVDPNVSDYRGTPLFAAASNKNEGVVEALVRKGARVDAWGFKGTPLIAAADAGNEMVVNALLKNGADVNFALENNETALNKAVDGGRTGVVKILLESGVDLSSYGSKAAICYGAAYRNAEIVRLLLRHHADFSVTDCGRATPVALATESENADVVKILVDSGVDLGTNKGKLLIQAATHDKTRVMRVLLDAGTDPNVTDSQTGWTPLMEAAVGNHIDAVQLLLAKGADVNPRDSKGESALSLASKANHAEIVRLLSKAGAR